MTTMLRITSAACLIATLALGAPLFGQTAVIDSVDRAQRANVMIEATVGADRRIVASGVILEMHDGVAHIVTARHVLDRNFAGAAQAEPRALDSLQGFSVLTFDGVEAAATVYWLAPHGIDLAILAASLSSTKAEPAHWDSFVTPRVGAAVFSVGNPGGVGWVRTAGTLAQIRDYQRDGYAFRMLQTNLQLEPGDSGGGLYDGDGRLIGINSMAVIGADPRFPGGLGLSTALSPLRDLAPPQLGLFARNLDR